LNAYSKVNDPSGCCSRSACCSSDGGTADGQFHHELTGSLARFNVNDYAASVRVFALKPE
jgi:hypothetical protein